MAETHNDFDDNNINIDNIDINNNIDIEDDIIINKKSNILTDFISLIKLILPVVCLLGADFSINLIQIMFAGHMGSLEMASAALASSFCNVTGFSIGVGLLSAMDTLCSQAYGANNYKKIGETTNQSLVVLGIVALLTFPIWMMSNFLLTLLGQDPDVIELASLYIRIAWFGLYPSSIYSILRRYLQNQNIVEPLTFAGFFSLSFSSCTIAILYLLNLGFIAIPITVVLTKIASSSYLILYIYFHGIWKLTWVPITIQQLLNIGTWLRLAIPGMIMLCAEWWVFEINIIISGLISVNALAAMTLVYTVVTVLYTFPLCISMAASTKVGNAIGASNIPQARRMSILVIILAFGIQSCICLLLYVTRYWWPLIFTNDDEVIDLIINTIIVTVIFELTDSTQTSIGGILRGVGKQKIGAFTYLLSYYLIGLPIGSYLSLSLDYGIKGLWIGISSASMSCLIILMSYFLFFLNWQNIINNSKNLLKQDDEINNNEIEIELSEITNTNND